jgi:uncharacterized protein YecT (DUF1311 family)
MPGDQRPRTLLEAHKAVWQQRPGLDADPSAWVAFHRRSAGVYAAAARVDGGHRREASQCAVMEIRRAREIEHRLDPGLDDES